MTFKNLPHKTTKDRNRRRRGKKKSFKFKIKFLGNGKNFGFKVNKNSAKLFPSDQKQ